MGIPTNGLVIYLPFYSTDLQGSSLTSKDINNYSCAVTGALWGNKGRTFDATDDTIAVTGLSANLYSILFWWKPTNARTNASADEQLADFGDVTLSTGGCTGVIVNEVITLIDSGAAQGRTGVVNITIDTGWHFMGFIWNVAQGRYDIIIDLVTQTVTKGTANNHCPLIPATAFDFGTKADGIIGEALGYNRALSEAERNGIYNDAIKTYKACWDFFSYA